MLIFIIILIIILFIKYLIFENNESFSNKLNKKKELKFCICFFGVLSRSLEFTIDSINNNIIKVLNDNNIKYDIYTHNMKVNNIFSLQKNEKNIEILDKIYLLKPNYFSETNQNEFDNNYDWNKYSKYGYIHNSLNVHKNAIRQIYSVNEVTKMWQKSKIEYDYYIYIRPDLMYINKLNLDEILENINNDILLTPKWHKWRGLNDRIYMGTKNIIKYFGNRFNYIDNFYKDKKRSYHPETFMKYVADKFNVQTKDIELKAKRVRSNGKIRNENFNE